MRQRSLKGSQACPRSWRTPVNCSFCGTSHIANGYLFLIVRTFYTQVDRYRVEKWGTPVNSSVCTIQTLNASVGLHTRLWCNFELSIFVKSHGLKNLRFVPLWLTPWLLTTMLLSYISARLVAVFSESDPSFVVNNTNVFSGVMSSALAFGSSGSASMRLHPTASSVCRPSWLALRPSRRSSMDTATCWKA